MSEPSSGLYDKYEVRKDGEAVQECFVLEPRTDPAAREAIVHYAHATDDDELAEDLLAWMDEIERGGEDIAVSSETARTALSELDMLIEETAGDDPDPLTDDVFRARDELAEAVGRGPSPSDGREGQP